MKIGIVTATRAEYGLLKNIIRECYLDEEIDLSLIVTGTHLIKEYGNTVQFIEEDGIPINHKIYVDIDSSSSYTISLSMADYFKKFAELYRKDKFDFLVVLGDRYELIPICSAAFIFRIPIAHISGGEVTEGAIDDSIRHCITKLSYLHFPACDTYRKRIIQLGEDPSRVFNVGDPGVENVYKMPLLEKQDLSNKIGVDLSMPYFVVVFHPITLENANPIDQIKTVLEAIKKDKKNKYIFLKSNADTGADKINEIIENEVKVSNGSFYLLSSIRVEEFLSLQKYSSGVIGNSSSGIIETPCFCVPTINIGDRQKGRLMAKSIISVPINVDSIYAAICKATSKEFLEYIQDTENLYGHDDTSKKIVKIIKEFFHNGVNLKKPFYDLEVK